MPPIPYASHGLIEAMLDFQGGEEGVYTHARARMCLYSRDLSPSAVSLFSPSNLPGATGGYAGHLRGAP